MKLTSAAVCPGRDHRSPCYKGWNWCARPTHLSALMFLRRIARRYPLTLGVAIGTFCAHGACDKPAPPPVCVVIDRQPALPMGTWTKAKQIDAVKNGTMTLEREP